MNIVTLSTYPFDRPRHGGQHRLANIAAQYRAAGHTVESVGVLGSVQYPATTGFVACPTPQVLSRYIDNTFLMEDWAIGQWAAHDDDAFQALAEKIPPNIDMLHVEQPWLFEFARRYIASRSTNAMRLLYGSENIEYKLKEGIVDSFLGAEHARECAERVLKCELQAITGAAVVAAVSPGDVAWICTHTQSPVVLAPNGVSARKTQQPDFVDANRCTGHRKFALYCASAHPPNIAGFYDMFGQGIGCLAPDERLVIAGGAGPAIQGSARFASTPGLARHMLAAGEVNEETLSALLQLAHAMVLPITQGEGTNLKTAEALWAGHHVVATPVAMRGFESFMTSSGVTIAETAIDFRAATREAMNKPPLQLSAADREARRVVLWGSCLRPLVEQVNQMASSSR